jgi:hypothetical protein
MDSFNANHNSLDVCFTTVFLIRSQKYFRTNRVSVCPAGIQRQLLCSPIRFTTVGLRTKFFYLTLHSEAFCSSNKLLKSESIQNELQCEGVRFCNTLRYCFFESHDTLIAITRCKHKVLCSTLFLH